MKNTIAYYLGNVVFLPQGATWEFKALDRAYSYLCNPRGKDNAFRVAAQINASFKRNKVQDGIDALAKGAISHLIAV